MPTYIIIYWSMLFLRCLSAGPIRLPIKRMPFESGLDVYSIMVDLVVDGQSLRALIDTGTWTTFFVWKSWYEKGQPGGCSMLTFGCYECPGQPCMAGPTETDKFADGSGATWFKRNGMITFASVSTKLDYGLLSKYDYIQDIPVPHASFGLAPNADKSSSYIPIIQQLRSQKLIDNSRFSVYLKPGKELAGELLIGADDPVLYKGPLRYISLVKPRFLQLTELRIGSNAASKIPLSDLAELDTGADSFYMPKYIVPRVISDLQRRGSRRVLFTKVNNQYKVKCADQRYLPPMTFSFKGAAASAAGSGVELELPPSVYVQPCESGSGAGCELCKILISGIDDDIWGFGYPSLIGKYFTYDWDKLQLGVADLK
ncbi:hypothetical protein FOL47_000063 [Perkinsus chesapeaki]|uniref:Peptidase A1 domain-containing protein n=1 Tax=Perkinsus chesapeaki TaxID=330153 RepID=A0A7J6N3V3_PERCH|nr:hypothetical protein FOL47_000063 [Perkinsus chesapeaki]